jgi:hypothetical protein
MFSSDTRDSAWLSPDEDFEPPDVQAVAINAIPRMKIKPLIFQ